MQSHGQLPQNLASNGRECVGSNVIVETSTASFHGTPADTVTSYVLRPISLWSTDRLVLEPCTAGQGSHWLAAHLPAGTNGPAIGSGRVVRFWHKARRAVSTLQLRGAPSCCWAGT